MPDIQITDDLGNSAAQVTVDLKNPSSLLKYAQTELLHLIVVPEFVQRAPKKLAEAAPNPISFQLKLEHKFQLGGGQPEIDLKPSFAAAIRVNATGGSELFDAGVFPDGPTVPTDTGYVSVAFTGSLDLGISGTAGDLTFGFNPQGSCHLEYWRAFPLEGGGPTLGEATGETLSNFVIPARIDDLKRMSVNDICAVSGEGSLTLSAEFDIGVTPNPLASVSLPLNAGKVEVKHGLMAGISASYQIMGAYQIRVRRTADAFELGLYKQRGATLTTAIRAGGGVSARFGNTELITALLTAIGGNPVDAETQKLFGDGGLAKDEIATLAGAIKDSVDHSLRAALELALAATSAEEAVFLYEIRPELLNDHATAAIALGLRGDLTKLVELESGSEGAVLAPGLKLVTSILTRTKKHQATLKFNLLGLVNYLSLTEMIRKSVVVRDPDTGDLTIADSATGNQINAESQPIRRNKALREAMFESLMVTATYRVSNTVEMKGLASHNFHFEFNNTTTKQTLLHLLNWFVRMNLISQDEQNALAGQLNGAGPSTCLLRTEFDDAACESLFFQSPGVQWDEHRYLETGRQALRALINPENSDADRVRYELLDRHWEQAVKIGANDNLADLVRLHVTNSSDRPLINLLIGDVVTITWWADAMRQAGQAILEMRGFLAAAGPDVDPDDKEFTKRRKDLQKRMAGVMGKSRSRFDEPWGFISLFWAAGSRGGSGKLIAPGVSLRKPAASANQDLLSQAAAPTP
jgi:hypothetical protein